MPYGIDVVTPENIFTNEIVDAMRGIAKPLDEYAVKAGYNSDQYPIVGYWTHLEVGRMGKAIDRLATNWVLAKESETHLPPTLQLKSQLEQFKQQIEEYDEDSFNDNDEKKRSTQEAVQELVATFERTKTHMSKVRDIFKARTQNPRLTSLGGEATMAINATRFTELEKGKDNDLGQEAEAIEQDIQTSLLRFFELYEINPALAQAYLAAAITLTENLMELEQTLGINQEQAHTASMGRH